MLFPQPVLIGNLWTLKPSKLVRELKYYENLDGLRGIAALMVLIFHFFGYPITDHIETRIYAKATEFGQHGVSLFFVLSGFVITRILIQSKANDDYFRRFYWRRALRIFPLYYGFLLFWYFVMPLLLPERYPNITPFKEQVPFYLYLQNLSELTGLSQAGAPQFWSLAVEEHFYFFWPLVIFVTPLNRLKGLIIGIIILVIPLKLYFLHQEISINKITFTRFDQILLGALLAYYEATGLLAERKKYFKRVFETTLLAIVPISVMVYVGQSLIPNIKEVFKYNLLGLIFFSIIGWLIVEPEKKVYNTVLRSPVLQYLGKISYGIYVWHLFVILFIGDYFATEIIIVDLLLSVLFTILVAHISYFYFEKKMLAYV